MYRVALGRPLVNWVVYKLLPLCVPKPNESCGIISLKCLYTSQGGCVEQCHSYKLASWQIQATERYASSTPNKETNALHSGDIVQIGHPPRSFYPSWQISLFDFGWKAVGMNNSLLSHVIDSCKFERRVTIYGPFSIIWENDDDRTLAGKNQLFIFRLRLRTATSLWNNLNGLIH
jgi:hypothetical protein